MLKALLAYYVLLLLIVFAWPTWRLWRRERINALVLPSEDTAEGVIGIWFKGLIAAVALIVTAFAVGLPPRAIGELPWVAAAPLMRSAGPCCSARSPGWRWPNRRWVVLGA